MLFFFQYKILSLWHHILQGNWTSDTVCAAECNLHEVYFVTVNDSSLLTSYTQRHSHNQCNQLSSYSELWLLQVRLENIHQQSKFSYSLSQDAYWSHTIILLLTKDKK